MKRYWGILAVLFLSAVSAKAQLITGGIVGGISTTSVKITELNTTAYNEVRGKGIMNVEGGLYGRLNLEPFYIKPMAMVDYMWGQVSFFQADGQATTGNFKDGKFEVPVLAGFDILGLFSIEAGPVYNHNFYVQADNDLKLKEDGMGYRAGVCVNLGPAFVGLAYQGLYNNRKSNLGVSTFYTPNQIILDLGIGL